ncbi:MAG: sigma-70 family RNA polymerase sigma factor [Caulobacterales bacterium]
MTPSATFKQDLIALMPSLRAFAHSLAGQAARADDLVQDTIVKALSHAEQFQPGTNLRAWLFTILRNQYYSLLRKQRREVEDVDGQHALRMSSKAAQEDAVDLEDFKRALYQLPADQREVLILIGASGCSYEEAADICGCAVGTIKSRANRARRRLSDMLGMTEESASRLDALTERADTL